MTQEDYVSFEIAKLFKEKGFEQHKCRKSYDSKGVFKWSDDLDPYECSAPTHQMAMKWLREVHELLISIDAYPIYGKVKDEKDRNTCGLIYWNYIASGEWINDRHDATTKAFVVSGKSYGEAVEAALKYVLENLI